MMPLVRILARLYPAAWRAKYGAEFDALIVDSRAGVREVLNVATGALQMQFTTWGYGRFAIAGIAIGIIAAAGAAFASPAEWRSECAMSSTAFQRGQWDDFTNVAKEAVSRGSLTRIV